jgi:hypothetical protein
MHWLLVLTDTADIRDTGMVMCIMAIMDITTTVIITITMFARIGITGTMVTDGTITMLYHPIQLGLTSTTTTTTDHTPTTLGITDRVE